MSSSEDSDALTMWKKWPIYSAVEIDRIPHNTLHARFEGKRNKGRPRLRWTDNVKGRHRINWTVIEESNGFDKWLRTMEVIHSYPSLPNGWRQELMMVHHRRRRHHHHHHCQLLDECGSMCETVWHDGASGRGEPLDIALYIASVRFVQIELASNPMGMCVF